MARQEGIIKLNGRIGDLTFYKTRNGYLAREKGGVDASRIASDPRYQRTRENMAEFGRATKASKFLRIAFKALTSQIADKNVSNRLMPRMLKVIQADSINERGLRMVLDAETELLTGFEFNANANVGTTVNVQYITAIDRAAGVATVNLPAFSARDMINSPQGSTHFKLSAAFASVNFENEVFELSTSESAVLDVKEIAIPAIAFSCQLQQPATSPLFLLLGINFYQRVNNFDYPLSNGAFNGLSLVQIQGL
ncbi:hypothetical protein [Pedobacter mendelii]|uniref:Uncharacterized protein n=1 Tax=Pedobacter mendelii TaxID=1908240 RepID=A0ABQ2BL17_9SPHI|nr:hypothetical protein [Pedobacter mendelii]GGI28403.1 hypothetical protein GCM10008119_32470 [Pedobacter mendelii]